MKTIAAAAVAVMCFAGFAHSAESTVNFEAMAEATDTLSYSNRCILWDHGYVCTI